MKRARVAIIVLNWNRWRDTLACLESVRQLAYPDYLTIVVDNGSWDDSVPRIKTWTAENVGKGFLLVEYTRANALLGGEQTKEEALEITPPASRMVLIRNEENLGRTGGVNVAIEYALRRKYPADYVFLLDDDAKVDKECITILVELDRQVNAGIVGGVVLDQVTSQPMYSPRGSVLQYFFAPFVRSDRPPQKMESEYWISSWVAGAAMLIRRDVLSAVYSSTGRYLHPGLFMDGEELEFCHVSRRAGYKSVVTKNGIVWHKEARSHERCYNPIRHYYITRNLMLLAPDLLPLHWRVLFHLVNLPLCLARVSKMLISRKPDAARAVICGLLDGYKGVTGKWKSHDKATLGRK